MIGVEAIDSCSCINSAVSNPSISGICTSSSTTAKRWRSIKDSASLPELAVRSSASSPLSTFWVAIRFASRSSTIRIFGASAAGSAIRAAPSRAIGSSRDMLLASDLLVDPLLAVDRFELILDRAEVQGFLVAQSQEPAVAEAVGEQAQHAVLQLLV